MFNKSVVKREDAVRGTMKKIWGKRRAIVTNIGDEKNRYRIKVKVPSLTSKFEINWANPCLPYVGEDHGFFMPPSIGDGVWVEFEKGDPRKPIWVGYWYKEGEIPVSEEEIDEELLKFIRRIKTESGHTFTMYDEEDKEHIKLESSGEHKLLMNDEKEKEYIELESSAGHTVRLNDQEDTHYLEIITNGGHTIKLNEVEKDGVLDSFIELVTSSEGHGLTLSEEEKDGELVTSEATLYSGKQRGVVLDDISEQVVIKSTKYTLEITDKKDEENAVFNTKSGHKFEFYDVTDEEYVELSDKEGNKVSLKSADQVVEITDKNGNIVEFDSKKDDINVTSNNDISINASGNNVNIDAANTVNFQGGGSPVARVGDEVEVEIKTGSSTGFHKGVITEGSSKVKSG